MTSWSSIAHFSRRESCDGNESDGVYSSIVVYEALRVDRIGQVSRIVIQLLRDNDCTVRPSYSVGSDR